LTSKDPRRFPGGTRRRPKLKKEIKNQTKFSSCCEPIFEGPRLIKTDSKDPRRFPGGTGRSPKPQNPKSNLILIMF
jgi:hypothetical protein